MKQKRRSSMFLLLAILLALAGCGGTNQKGQNGSDAREEAADQKEAASDQPGAADDKEAADQPGAAGDKEAADQPETADRNSTAANQPNEAADKPGAAVDQTGDAKQGTSECITIEEAKAIVLENIGISEAEVQFVRVQLDTENGLSQYELELVSETEKYDYEVNAVTGEILSMNTEPNTNQGSSQSYDHNTDYNHNSENQHHEYESSHNSDHMAWEQVKQIALDYAGFSQEEVRHMEIQFDYEDGRAEYELEWYVGRTEYSCDIDALTGEVLSFEKDMD